MDKQLFVKRLTQLRVNKNVSAREMSLSLGQNSGYINFIENGLRMPSMEMFFEICDYLEVTPAEFFDFEGIEKPEKIHLLMEQAQKLSDKSMDLLIELTGQMV